MKTPCKALSTSDGRRIHFAVMAIESGARNLGVTSREMHDRLKKQNLIHTRLIGRYDLLHTQSREWVADDIVETLKNWEQFSSMGSDLMASQGGRNAR